jgi:metallo-beta-lactamase family protein
MSSIQFLGAAGTVTGSRFLVDAGSTRFLVDCGMFQGAKKLRLLNWEPQPVPPPSIDHVLLTHAHIDHVGMLPVLVRDGFQGSIWSTAATRELAEISLLDSAHLQEEDARFANKKGFSKHKPALPLYTVADSARALEHFRVVEYDQPLLLSDGTQACFRDAGHMLGSATIETQIEKGRKSIRLVFSGDLGRYNALVMRDPTPVEETDYLVLESTYGARPHAEEEAFQSIAEIINRTARRGGMLLVPAFAVGRTQTMLYVLRELKAKSLIPDLPVYVDSPMAIQVTELFGRHIAEFDEEARAVFRATGQSPVLCPNLHFARSSEESQKINDLRYPAIILSASGMATGGRILHHLKHRLPDERNTVLFVGFQSNGTRGQILKDGAREIKIHGEQIPVRAQIRALESFSGHADSADIIRWLGGFRRPPKLTFIVHGEPEASEALAGQIRKVLGWKTHIPLYLESSTLR